MYAYTDNTCNNRYYIAVAERGEGRAPEGLRTASGKLIEFPTREECQAEIDRLRALDSVGTVELVEEGPLEGPTVDELPKPKRKPRA